MPAGADKLDGLSYDAIQTPNILPRNLKITFYPAFLYCTRAKLAVGLCLPSQ
ncbi:hypothetical protein SBV1_450026 [Verrucomicrobia bacterium]|nr:hypothetical protein SBV1_450026 [Verrucomicrobiota bacterium]